MLRGTESRRGSQDLKCLPACKVAFLPAFPGTRVLVHCRSLTSLPVACVCMHVCARESLRVLSRGDAFAVTEWSWCTLSERKVAGVDLSHIDSL